MTICRRSRPALAGIAVNLQVARWVLQYRFSRGRTLLAQEVVLHHAVMSRRNVKLLQQQGAQGEPNYTYWTSEKSSRLFAGFFTPQASLSEGGKQLTRYLDPRDKQAMACVSRSSYSFFKPVLAAARPVPPPYESKPTEKPAEEGKTTFECFNNCSVM